MKSTIISLFTLFLVTSFYYAGAQPWMNNISSETKAKGKVNFYDIQKAFDEYWLNKKIEKGKGWRQFKRWENFMEPRIYPSGKLPKQTYWKEYQQKIAKGNAKSIIANWKLMGPTETPKEINTNINRGSGRLNCIEFHPTDPNIFWVGAPAGGFWKTTDGGNTWATTTDELQSLGISDIAVNPQNPLEMYIGTGDRDHSDTYSIGILKSTDGGDTWNTTGLQYIQNEAQNVNRILINPNSPSILIAATNSAIYRSTNSGADWTEIIGGNFIDLEFKPNDVSVIYASTYERWGGGSTIYKSTNNGASFNLSETGITPSEINRIELAVSPNNPQVVYAFASSQSTNGFYALYKSTNSGTSWSVVTDNTSINLLGWQSDGADSGGQGWYDLSLAVSPTNANIVYTGGVNIWKSTDGGASWNINAHWYGNNAAYVHADQHAFKFNPLTNNLFSCNDGGLHKTDDGTNWIDLSSGLEILQIYRIGTSYTDESLVVSGAQDNGTMKVQDDLWEAIMGGDGMECLVDYTNKDIIYAEYYYGNISRSIDGGNTFYSIKPQNSPNGAWITPFIIDPVNHNTLYMGFDNVYKTTNGGDNWTTISNGFTNGENLQSLVIAPSNTNYLYAATYDVIYKTTNGGTDWSDITTGLPSHSITYIAVSSANPNHILVSLSGYTENEKVFKSIDGGANWTNYSDGLPNIPANCITYENNAIQGVYVGTDLGVYYRNNTMSSWIDFNGGLPNVVVDELEIHYPSRKLRAATFGRGLWESNLYDPPAFPTADFTNNFIDMCSGIVKFNDISVGSPESWLWNFGDGQTSIEQNPTHQYAALGDYPVKLTVSNSFGTDDTTRAISVILLPIVADYETNNNTFCSLPAEVSFTNLSQNGSSFSWNFGDTQTSIDQNPTHSYTTQGVYDVTLYVTSLLCGTNSVIKTGIVNINPSNIPYVSMPENGIATTQTCCNGFLFDSGGASYYQNNTNSTITIVPDQASSIKLTFSEFEFENNFDYLYIYDGPSINSPLIGEYTGFNFPEGGIINSTGGAITIRQITDPGVTEKGFELNWTCLTTDIKNIENKPVIRVYPNPSKGNINIEFEQENREDIFVSVMNVSGQKVFEQQFKSTNGKFTKTLSLETLSKEIYQLQIIVGETINNSKIVLQ